MSHTPGPWRVKTGTPALDQGDSLRIVADNAPRIADVDARLVSYNEQAANARLIAAAPELLAACQSILDHWESGNFSREHDLWNGLRAAIAKAETPTHNTD